jgi:hypothetical protein
MQPVIQDSFQQLTHDGLLRFEAEHRIELPADYRQWLIQHNGGTFGGRAVARSPEGRFQIQRIYGIETGIEYGEGRPMYMHPAEPPKDEGALAGPQQPSQKNPLLAPFARDIDGDELAFTFVSQREMGPIARLAWPRPDAEPVPQAWWSFSEFLESIGPDPDFRSRWDEGPEPFRLIVHGDAAEVERRLPDFPPNEMDARGDTLVAAAVSTGRPDVVALLLAHGANPSLSNHRGESPLHAAAAAGSLDGTRLLLDAGARIDATDADGNTPVVRATQSGHIRVALLLIERGANPRLRNLKGRAVADYCDDPLRARYILPRVAA